MNILITLFLVLAVVLHPNTWGSSLNARINSIASPYRYSVMGWEVGSLWQEATHIFQPEHVDINDTATVIKYFTLSAQIRNLDSQILAIDSGNSTADRAPLVADENSLDARRQAITKQTEEILGAQVRQALTEEGIYNPFSKGSIDFPPLNFKFKPLPELLVISPRNRIYTEKEVLLEPGLTLAQKEKIEASADKLGVSSLVTDIGGIAVYPSLVDNGADLRFTLDTITEEWLHQYLAFTPLGFRYVLHLARIHRDYTIVGMNESLAGMVSQAIGGMVFKKYYPQLAQANPQSPDAQSPFTIEMRQIRKTVDTMLAAGQVDQAEAYMDQQRLKLVSQGYYIRKLNQAYFAFHGSYGDLPAYASPIGGYLQKLRDESSSLKQFLDRASVMTNVSELAAAVK